ncbi:Hypothetical predicted protein, partial [Mytilus galloprovincialis]
DTRFSKMGFARLQHSELKTKGHDFVLQHLSNPTWCDECGDFIWGLYKQCLRCRTQTCDELINYIYTSVKSTTTIHLSHGL